MVKVIAFLSRLPHVAHEQFKAHYEQQHVPMILELLPMLRCYERNYPDPARTRLRQEGVDGVLGYDAITLFKFADLEAFGAYKTAMKTPAIQNKILEDESKFLDRSKTRVFFLEEHVSADVPLQE